MRGVLRFLTGILLTVLACLRVQASYREIARAGSVFCQKPRGGSRIPFWSGRGGDVASPDVSTKDEAEDLSLDDKVHAAMRKLGLTPPSSEQNEESTGDLPDSSKEATTGTSEEKQEDVQTIVDRIAKDMHVDPSLALAALGATSELLLGGERKFDEDAARNLIQQELDMIGTVSEDSEEVKQLVSEGYDLFMSRRALAFAEMNMDDARAILIADQQDEEEAAVEAKMVAEAPQATAHSGAEDEAEEIGATKEFKTVNVDASFDPTSPKVTVDPRTMPTPATGATSSQSPSNMKPPTPAKKADVVFDATSSQVQELVMESPVPVLLDVYADWCGPCKALTPALEEMAVKAGGIFRLVKINTDNERAISGALEVTSLPTVFGVKDGKIVNVFKGMPRSDDFMKNFMMGLLMPGASFDPPVSTEDQLKFADLSSKLAKVAGTACLSFSTRERLQDRTVAKLDGVVDTCEGSIDVEDSVKVLRSLMSNVIRDPYDTKFRRVNLQNKVLAAKIATFPQFISILKSVGFVEDGTGALVLGKNTKIVNVAPLLVVRDTIDKWLDKNRYEMAKAARRRRDEIDRARLASEREAASEEEEEEEQDDIDEAEEERNTCKMKLRLEGKNKVHEVVMDGDDPLKAVLDVLQISKADEKLIQLTCVAKRLVVKSTDDGSMQKTLREHNLLPAASIVVKVLESREQTEPLERTASSGLAERAAARRNRKKGSHTMQSVGIYSKDDNNKANIVDGGGGTVYEHDITDDEGEDEPEMNSEDNAEESGDESETNPEEALIDKAEE